MAISAASLSVEVDANVSAAQAALADIDAQIRGLAFDHAPIVVNATVDQALTGIDSVTTAADDLASVAPNVLVDADISAATDGLAEVSDSAAAVADTAVTATVDADTDAALSALDDVQSTAESIDGQTVSVAVEADTAKAQGALDGLTKAFGDVIKVGAGFTLGKGLLAAPGVLRDMAHAAADDSASVTRLQTSVNNAEGGWSKYGTQIDAAIKRGQQLAFSDDDVRAALSKLTTQTGSAGEALNRLSVAEDFARGAGIDLGTAAKLLGKVTDESSAALSRYGIVLEKGASAQEALNEVDKRFGGQAGAFAESDAGKFAIMSDKVQELQESLGAALLPALSAAAAAVGVFASAMQAATSTGIGAETIKVAAAAIGGVLVVALGAAAVAAVSAGIAFIGLTAAALPWIALAAGIAAGLVLINDKWHIFGAGADAATASVYRLIDANEQYIISADGTAYSVDRAGLTYDRAAAAASEYLGFQVTALDVQKGFIDGTDGISYSLDRFVVAAATGTRVTKDWTTEQLAGAQAMSLAKEAMIATAEAQVSNAVKAQATADSLYNLNAAADAGTQSWVFYAAGADSAWAGQSRLNDMLSQASGAVSFWESNLKGAEGALKILNDQTASGIPLDEKQQGEFDLLTTAVGRYQGGIEDSQGAVVDAAAAQAAFILVQDDLNGKLAAGTISQGEYDKAMSAATAATDPATSSAYGLASAQDTVAVAIEGVVNKLGNMLIDLGLLPESKRTEFQTPGLDDAITGVSNLGEGIGALPSSFTVTASVDIQGAMDNLNILGQSMPHSPAEIGPLSVAPDWQYIVDGLPSVLATGAQYMADGGAQMMDELRVRIDEGNAVIGNRIRDAGLEHGHIYGSRVREGALEELANLGPEIVAQLMALVPTLGDAGSALVKPILAAVANGTLRMRDAANLFTAPMVEALQRLEEQLTVQLAEALITGTDPTAIEAQLATIDALLTATTGVLEDAAAAATDLGTAATGAAGQLQAIGEAADTANGYLAAMGGYLSDAAMQMGNVASGATSLQDALNGMGSQGPTGGKPGTPAGKASGGGFSFSPTVIVPPPPEPPPPVAPPDIPPPTLPLVPAFVGVSAMVQQANQLQAALADMTDGLIDSASTFSTLDTNLNNIIDPSELTNAKTQFDALVKSLASAGYNTAAYLPAQTGAMGATTCPSTPVHLYLAPDQSTPIATWIGDEQASLALSNAGLRGF